MKKFLLFIPVLAVALLLTMTQCKKKYIYDKYECGLKVTCYFTKTGIDTGDVVPGADLVIYPGISNPQSPFDPIIDSNKNQKTDNKGMVELVYRNEALLNIIATYTDTADVDYIGVAQVKLKEGETVESAVLLRSGN